MAINGSEGALLKEMKSVYESFKWLIEEDIQSKSWDKLEHRLNAMEKEMALFVGRKRARDFISKLKLPKEVMA